MCVELLLVFWLFAGLFMSVVFFPVVFMLDFSFFSGVFFCRCPCFFPCFCFCFVLCTLVFLLWCRVSWFSWFLSAAGLDGAGVAAIWLCFCPVIMFSIIHCQEGFFAFGLDVSWIYE